MTKDCQIDLIPGYVAAFCEKVTVSEVGNDGFITPVGASYHTITTIRTTVSEILGREKIGMTGRGLQETLGIGRHVLDQHRLRYTDENGKDKYSWFVYAITREGVRRIFQHIADKDAKQKVPKRRDSSMLGIGWTGTTRHDTRIWAEQ